MDKLYTRRQVLSRSGKAAAAAAGVATAASVLPTPRLAAGAVSALEKVTLAVVGCGGRGCTLMRDFVARKDVDVSLVCDVDLGRAKSLSRELGNALGKAPDAVTDYRRVMDSKETQAVVVATPDHWHALVTVHACRASKDVYVEKPASYSIWDGRKMVEAARKYSRVVQVGLQNRSAPYVLKALEYIRSGELGKILFCRVCNLKSGGPFNIPADSKAPEGVDYDAWLGPAPARGFNAGHFHGGWYNFYAYCGGDMGNDSSHQLDIARWLVGKDVPKTVHCAGGNLAYKDARDVPDTQLATFEFDDLVMTLENTQWAPYMDKIAGDVRQGDLFPYWPQCSTRIEFYGTKALMFLGRHGGGWQVFVGSEPKSRPGKIVAQCYGRIPDEPHKENVVRCIRTRERPNADIEEGHRSAILSHLGNISYRVGARKLAFDATTETFVGEGAEAANRLVKPPYRDPYVIPDPV